MRIDCHFNSHNNGVFDVALLCKIALETMLREPFEAVGKYPSSMWDDWTSTTMLEFTAIHRCNRWIDHLSRPRLCTFDVSDCSVDTLENGPDIVDLMSSATSCILHQR